jgi:hypothetical protein
MKCRLLGFSVLDFTADDGNHVKGKHLHLAWQDPDVQGEHAGRVFVRDGIALPKISVGDSVNVSFDMKGKVESVESIKG